MHRTGPEWALLYVNVFRLIAVGTCLVAVVVALLAHVQWLLMAGACIAIGEFVECTYYILILEWAQRSGRLSVLDGSQGSCT